MYIIIFLAVSYYVFLLVTSQKVFGAKPKKHRLKRILAAENYKKNAFQNLSNTPNFGEGHNLGSVMKAFFLTKRDTEPKHIIETLPFENIPHQKEDTSVVWFGHSSYLLTTKSKRFLIDPVLDGNASPFDFFGKPYAYSNNYKMDDIKDVDFVILTHDHFDHLDYKSIQKLVKSNTIFYCSLGVGAHLEHWGISEKRIHELTWWESIQINEELKLTACPSRHFSGRTFKRNQTLWSSFVLESGDQKIYLGGDSGYDLHFKTIFEKFGAFDLSILECGQYNPMWPYIHMQPEEVYQAAIDLKTKVLLPVHWAKFSLALHKWNDPINSLIAHATPLQENMEIATPRIGEYLFLNKAIPKTTWWEANNN